MIRLVALAGAALVLFAPLAVGAPPARDADTGASAVLLRVTVPGSDGVSLGELVWPTNPGAEVQSFQYPNDGSIVSVGRSRARVSAQPGVAAAAQALSEVTVLSLFGGEIVAGRLTASTTAGASERSVAGSTSGSSVTGLRALGQDVSTAPGTTASLADWGTLTVLADSSGSRPRPPAAQGSIVALQVRLSADHGGLPAGSEIAVASASAVAVAVERLGPPPRGLGPTPRPTPAPSRPTVPPAPEAPDAGETVPGGPVRVAPEISTTLSRGGYVFPIYGTASFGDSFGGPRPAVKGGWHHGEDLFAPLGAPVLAVADGALHTIGFNRLGGYRLWLRDDLGNEFYYAHLSAYSPLAVEGRRVEAGDVIGFVGDTGDADGGSPHLHFEIHPASMLGLGYDGVVAPYPILLGWRRAEDVSFSAGRVYVPTRSGPGALPPPGAVLLQADDIGSTSGLVPGALERALAPG